MTSFPSCCYRRAPWFPSSLRPFVMLFPLVFARPAPSDNSHLHVGVASSEKPALTTHSKGRSSFAIVFTLPAAPVIGRFFSCLSVCHFLPLRSGLHRSGALRPVHRCSPAPVGWIWSGSRSSVLSGSQVICGEGVRGRCRASLGVTAGDEVSTGRWPNGPVPRAQKVTVAVHSAAGHAEQPGGGDGEAGGCSEGHGAGSEPSCRSGKGVGSHRGPGGAGHWPALMEVDKPLHLHWV